MYRERKNECICLYINTYVHLRIFWNAMCSLQTQGQTDLSFISAHFRLYLLKVIKICKYVCDFELIKLIIIACNHYLFQYLQINEDACLEYI